MIKFKVRDSVISIIQLGELTDTDHLPIGKVGTIAMLSPEEIFNLRIKFYPNIGLYNMSYTEVVPNNKFFRRLYGIEK